MPSSDSDDLEIVYGEIELTEKDHDEQRRKSWFQKYLEECYTIAMGNLISIIFFLGPCLFFYLCTIPTFWPLVILYVFWMVYDRKTPHRGGRKFPIVRKLPMWRSTKKYFPVKMVKTAELPANKNYLIAAFPHGALSYGMACNVMTDANNFSEVYPGLQPYVATMNQSFFVPISRDVGLAVGFCACSGASIKYILNGPPGNVCVVVVGGVAEMMKSTPGTNKLVLRNRKGFVRLALKAGAALVPVFSFGETNTFYQPTNKIYKFIQETLKDTINMPLFILNGRGIFQPFAGSMPKKTPITTIFGKPIDLPKTDNPTEEDVDKYHRKFISELENIFHKFKGKYDPKGEDAVLEIY